jgi:hypothetical protein
LSIEEKVQMIKRQGVGGRGGRKGRKEKKTDIRILVS